MKIVFLDFETFYDDEYSLRKMTPVEYVLDPRFEVTGCAVQEGLDGAPYWLDGDLLPRFFVELDPKVTMLVTHNALFDMCIVSWHYGFNPRMMCCTLSVARACLGHVLRRLSLASVSKHLGLPDKGDTIMHVKGMNLAAIKAAGLYHDYVNYALGDVRNCAGIFKALVSSGQFPATELVIMDMVLRCGIEPKFKLDSNALAEHLGEVQVKKQHLLAKAMLLGADGKSNLMSNERFAELLRKAGVEPPKKISPVTGKYTYAFAKSDAAFLDLQEHEDPAVQILVSARLGHKSTLEETRTERFLKIANLRWPAAVTHPDNNPQLGLMPVPLRFSGAHTHRLSGDWKLNLQNMPRGGKLRRALTAPPGHTIMAIDSSQIEARGVAALSGQQDLIDDFASGRDVYLNFASYVFNKPLTKAENKTERFVGKQAILGLGYGLGATKFRARLKTDSKNQTGTAIELTEDQAQMIVTSYRSKYHRVPATWKLLNYTGIPALRSGSNWMFGPCVFEKESILLPSGLRLFYYGLEQNPSGEWWFRYGGEKKKLYGGKLLENITQALARIIVMDAGRRIRKRTGFSFSLQAHDELVFVVPDEAVESMRVVMLEEMLRRPDWAPQWPVAADDGVKTGQSYGECK